MTRSARRALPIRTRVTLWYAASVGAVLVVAALIFRLAFAEALSAEFDRALADSAALVRSFFALEVAEYGSAEATVVHLSAEVAFPDRRIVYVRPDHRTISGSRGGSMIDDATRTREEALDLRHAPGWRVRIVASTDPVTRPLGQIDALALFGVPFGAALAGIVGWWLAGRTLQPVAEMAEAIERVTPGTAAGESVRVPVRNADDELGRLGTRFNALLDRLDRALGQQRQFLADAAHELRTPVARTLSGVELALLDAEPNDGHVAALTHAQHDLRRIGRLVDELLQLARADAAGGPGSGPGGRPQLARVYLDDVVADTLAGWRAPAQAAGLRLTQSAVDEAPINADAVLVERLLSVLIDNAVRYTPCGGTVDVRVCRHRAAGAAVLEVVDTGIGLDPTVQARATERFFRGTAARQRQPDGSGLGLAIARVLAEAHEAVLTLEPRPRGGTIARVTFPSPPA